MLRRRYGWNITRLSNNCQCGIKFDKTCFSLYKKQLYISTTNRKEEFTAKLLKEIYLDVRLKPQLYLLKGLVENYKQI